jgi:hypothetical protein
MLLYKAVDLIISGFEGMRMPDQDEDVPETALRDHAVSKSAIHGLFDKRTALVFQCLRQQNKDTLRPGTCFQAASRLVTASAVWLFLYSIHWQGINVDVFSVGVSFL